MNAAIVYSPFFLLIFTLLSPFVLALKKFGKRSYFQRLPKVYSKCKMIADSIVFVIILVLTIFSYSFGKGRKDHPAGKYKTFPEYFKNLFCCCCKKKNDSKKKEKKKTN